VSYYGPACPLFLPEPRDDFVNPITLDTIQWKLCFVYIATLLVMLPITLFLFPETWGRTLEVIADVFHNAAPSPHSEELHKSAVLRNSTAGQVREKIIELKDV
jgi:hypothetical protein